MEFPVIVIKGSTLDFHRTEDSLGLCTKAAFKSGWFTGLTIVDANGIQYRVNEAKNLRKTGRRLFRSLFAPSLMKVDLEVSETRHLSIEEVRNAISAALKRDVGFWESSGLDLSHMLRKICEAKSISEIWLTVTPLLDARPPGP
jgi:hypothetical protein